jgi:hypothetical protein
MVCVGEDSGKIGHTLGPNTLQLCFSHPFSTDFHIVESSKAGRVAGSEIVIVTGTCSQPGDPQEVQTE